MDGEPATGGRSGAEPAVERRSRRPLVLGVVVAFGLLVALSGILLASVSLTLQGVGVAAVGILGLLLTAARLPRRLPWTVAVGALVLLATAAENARSGLSAWAPLGLLVGVALLSVPIRALPVAPHSGAADDAGAAPRFWRPEPRGAVLLVATGLALMLGYELVAHLFAPEAEDLPSYLAAIGMPFASAIGAGALALVAARRDRAAALAAGGALVLVSAGLYMAEAAGDAWWFRHTSVEIVSGSSGNETVGMIAAYSDAYRSTVSLSYDHVGPEAASTTLVVIGLALTVVGWWWAAVRRAAVPAAATSADDERGDGTTPAG